MADEPKAEQPATYLFTWKPERTPFSRLDHVAAEIIKTGGAENLWSCGTVKTIPVGSRVFLIRQGAEPRGIVGSGFTVGEVLQTPHWDKDRAASGEIANMVPVRFDALSRSPLIRRNELNEDPYGNVHWDTQMSGISIPPQTADALERLWAERRHDGGTSAAVVSAATVEHWGELWNEERQDTEWLEREHLRDAKRRDVLPEMKATLQAFLTSELSLPDFREVFDQKTRNEWDFFGLKGTSGAMFLNKLAKHLPDQASTAEELRAVLSVPNSDDDAGGKLRRFSAYLQTQIEAGVALVDVQPRRANFYASACWHLQDQRWPIMYQSGRKALQREG